MLKPETAKALNPQTWLEEHGDVLYRYALARVRESHVAEDLVQETFVAALRSRETYAGRASERTWLVAILRHKLIDHLRRRCREQPLLTGDEGENQDEAVDRLFDHAGHWQPGPQAWGDPAKALESAEFWEVMQRCLQGLPPRYGEVYALHELDGQSGDEVCQVFQISPSNLWVILHRARVRLRQCLEVNWFGNAMEKR